MKAAILRATALAAVLLLSAPGLSPASACLRTHEVRIEPAGIGVAERAAIADFLQIASYGARQKVVARVSGPDGELARRRVRALADLLVSQGLAATGIMLESDRNERERAVLIVYPQPRSSPAVAQASPAAPQRSCGG